MNISVLVLAVFLFVIILHLIYDSTTDTFWQWKTLMKPVRENVLAKSLRSEALPMFALKHNDTNASTACIEQLQGGDRTGPRTDEPSDSRKAMVKKIIYGIANLSNIKLYALYQNLTQHFTWSSYNLIHLYNVLKKRRRGELLDPEIKMEYSRFWRGHQLPAICGWSAGRLGNAMIVYSSLLILKKIYNVTVFSTSRVKKFQETFPDFSLPYLIGDERRKFTPLLPGKEHSPLFFRLQLASLGLFGPYLFRFDEFTFETKLFPSHREMIVREFRFSDHLLTKANDYLRSVTEAVHKHGENASVVLVGVHIRLTDYLEHVKKYGMTHLDYSNYLSRATQYYESLYDNVAFVVASDDVLPVINYFGEQKKRNVFFPAVSDADYQRYLNNSSFGDTWSPNNQLLIRERLPEEDMSLLAQCNHNIITLGTYGFWTGFLSSGTTLYPKPVSARNPIALQSYEMFKHHGFIPIPL